ncbi:LOW QUALITY PROTEIN: uncharacterized protein LOC110033297 [Phalaenopsis equestris]|uniref:LOW QUALITY PROTEIN: uncharacterized protein LOC110033297 n=1 Tax=Phalaenopsis equestris TaxID=78828 RepID=UPI0009E33091|nr:LOW QUALITY PROTEIN: uncharacterized protein LOC110033297 [Phalaenopsis equestris]
MEQRAMEMKTWNSGVVLSRARSDGDRRSVVSTNNEQLFESASARRGGITTISRSYFHGQTNSLITNESRQDSLGGINHGGLRRRVSRSLTRDLGDQMLESISISRELTGQILGEVDSSIVAQIGDSGDRSIRSSHEYDHELMGVPTDKENNTENGLQRSANDVEIVTDGFLSRHPGSKLGSPSCLLEADSLFPLPAADLMLHVTEKDMVQNMDVSSKQDVQNRLPPRLDYVSYLIHLAVFGILGVLTRYLLERLFGPDLLALTGDDTPLYLDLPSNMLGSFLMGWFGIVFKADVRAISEHLVIGITTGYMGSLTTFSGWNQKMLNLSTKGHWAYAVAGIILGMLIVNECINIGVESAEWLRRCFLEWIENCPERTKTILKNMRLDTFKWNVIIMIFMLVIWASLWGLSGTLAGKELDNLTSGAILWLGCLAGPVGVWARWYLARLNGQGLGKKGSLKWLPIGTLLANFLAACFMAALTTISKAVNTKRCTIILSGVQFGFLGCLSTVSTFVAEVYAMRHSGHPGRALSYALLTILPSFAAGILIYSIPVWTKHYH